MIRTFVIGERQFMGICIAHQAHLPVKAIKVAANAHPRTAMYPRAHAVRQHFIGNGFQRCVVCLLLRELLMEGSEASIVVRF